MLQTTFSYITFHFHTINRLSKRYNKNLFHTLDHLKDQAIYKVNGLQIFIYKEIIY